jgi:TldD protein
MINQNTQIAIATLLHANGLQEEDVRRSFDFLAPYRVDYCDLYFQKTLSEGYVLEEGIVKSGSFNIDCGVGIRAVSGAKSALAYSDEISMNAIREGLQTVRAVGTHSDAVSSVRLQARNSSRRLYPELNPIEQAEAREKIALLEKIEKMARAKSPLISQVIAHVNSVHDTVLIAGSDGRLIGDVRPLVRLGLSVIAEKDGRHEQGAAGGGARLDLSYFTDEILERYVNEAVESALLNLEAKPSPAGVLPVVLGCGWPGVLLHEAVGHGLEGDFNRKQTSVFTNRIGEQVAAKGVTVIDDGTIPERRGSLNIDDEGNETQRTVLIEDGILRGYLQDEMNARLTGSAVTGNGRRERFAHLPIPRMTNTFMLEGDKTPEEIIASVEYGIFAKNFGGGQVDITSGSFVFSMNEAWLIEKGRLTAPIKGATLIGNGADALTKIQMIGSDLALDSGVGTCGKDGQSVPVGVGMPTVRIDGLTVGGTEAQ